MKKGKSKKSIARRNYIRNQARQGHPFNNQKRPQYDPKEYDGSDPASEEIPA